jgi:hypothetical protein
MAMTIWIVQYGYSDDMTGGIDSVWSTRVAAEARKSVLDDDIDDNFLFYYVDSFEVDKTPR